MGLHKKTIASVMIAAYLLQGCATVGASYAPTVNQYGGVAGRSRAAQIFSQYESTGKLPGAGLSLKENPAVKSAEKRLKATIDSYRGKTQLTYDEQLEVAEAFANAFQTAYRESVAIDKLNASLGKSMGTGNVDRGYAAQLSFASLADGINLAASAASSLQSSPTPSSQAPITVTIPPYGKANLSFYGYCLNRSLGAPGEGEKFELKPIASAIPAQFLGLYYKAAALAAQKGSFEHAVAQNLMWNLSEFGSERLQGDDINKSTKELMEKLEPGSFDRFVSAHTSSVRRVRASGSGNSGLDKMVKSVNMINNTVSALNNAITSGDFTRLLEEAKGRKPTAAPENYEYTEIAPQVAAKTIGSGTLSADMTVLNNTPNPYSLHATSLLAKSYSDKLQRLGIGNINRAITSSVGTNSDTQQALADRWNDYLNDAKRFALDHGQEPLGRGVVALANYKAAKGWPFAGAMKSFGSGLIKSAPMVGGAIALYEATSGKDFLTGEALSPTEKLLAILSTVPGAAAVVSLGKGPASALVKAGMQALASTSAGRKVMTAGKWGSLGTELITTDGVAPTIALDRVHTAMNQGIRSIQAAILPASVTLYDDRRRRFS